MKTLILIILLSALSLAQTYDVGQTNANVSSALTKALAQPDTNTAHRNLINTKLNKSDSTIYLTPSDARTEFTQLSDSTIYLTPNDARVEFMQIADSTIYLTPADGNTAYQPKEATLTDIADGTIAENLVNTANPWAENEVASTLATETEAKGFVADSVANTLAEFDTKIGITGTPSASTFWRGDNSWATPSGSGDMTKAVYDLDNNTRVDDADSLAGVVASSYLLKSDSTIYLTSADAAVAYEPKDADITKLNEVETLSANWVNTANPWAENEIVSTMATQSEAITIAYQSKDSSLVEVTGNGKFLMGNVTAGWYQATTQQAGDTLETVINIGSLQGTFDSTKIATGGIPESKLEIDNAPTDEYVLTYEVSTGNFVWEADETGGAPDSNTIFLTINDAKVGWLEISDSTIYLTPNDARVEFTQLADSTIYLTPSDARTEFLQISDSTIYLTPADGNVAYQPKDADLTDLADGSLTASKVAGVADADYGDVTVSSGAWGVEDDSHNHVISNVDLLQDTLTAKVNTSWTSAWDKVENDDLNLSDSTIYLTPNDARVEFTQLSDSTIYLTPSDARTEFLQISDSTIYLTPADGNTAYAAKSSLTAFEDTLSYSWGVMDTTIVGALPGWKIPNNITIVEISAYTDANTCTFNLEERAETTPNTAGTDVMTSDLAADNNQEEQTSFANAAIDRNDWLVPTISATGDVEIFSITVRYVKTN